MGGQARNPFSTPKSRPKNTRNPFVHSWGLLGCFLARFFPLSASRRPLRQCCLLLLCCFLHCHFRSRITDLQTILFFCNVITSASYSLKYVNVPLLARVFIVRPWSREGRLLGSKNKEQPCRAFMSFRSENFLVLCDEAQKPRRQQRCGLDESHEWRYKPRIVSINAQQIEQSLIARKVSDNVEP